MKQLYINTKRSNHEVKNKNTIASYMREKNKLKYIYDYVDYIQSSKNHIYSITLFCFLICKFEILKYIYIYMTSDIF